MAPQKKQLRYKVAAFFVVVLSFDNTFIYNFANFVIVRVSIVTRRNILAISSRAFTILMSNGGIN